jgi:hypothetical protein
MMHPMTDQLVKQHMQQLLREAEAERLASEARNAAHTPSQGLTASVRAALAAIAGLGQRHAPAPTEPASATGTTGGGAGLSVATPAPS